MGMFARNLIAGVAAMAVVGVTAACGSSSSPPSSGSSDTVSASSGQKTATVRIALSSFQDVNALHVAKEKGYFEQAGIKAEFTKADWPTANELLTGGHVELANSSESDVMLQNAQGHDTTLAFPFFFFAGGGLMFDPKKHDWKPYSDLLKEANGDQKQALRLSLEQIKGKRLGVSKVSGDLPTFLGMVEYAGLNQSDYQIVDVVQDDLPPTLFSGSIDLMLGGLPQRLAAENRGFISLVDQTVLPSLVVHAGFAASRGWVDKNPDLARRLQEVMFKTLTYIDQNPDDGLGIISKHMKETGTEVSVEQLKGIWNKLEYFAPSRTWYEENVEASSGKFHWKSRFETVASQLLAGGQLKEKLATPFEDLNYGLKVVKSTSSTS